MAENYYRAFRRLVRTLRKKNLKGTADIYFQEQVLENVTFQNHIKEVAHKMNIPEEIVMKVVTHYFRSIIMIILNPPNHRVRVLIYGFFYLEIINPLYNEYSTYSLQYIKQNFKHFLTKIKKNQNGKR